MWGTYMLVFTGPVTQLDHRESFYLYDMLLFALEIAKIF